MAYMLRLNETEQKLVDELAWKINKIRIEKKEKPIRDSSIVHEVLADALEEVDVDAAGNLYYRKLLNLIYLRLEYLFRANLSLCS